MSIPKVFISYSHDNIEHKKWVLNVATRLRNNGIDAIIDQWELKPGDDLPHFMETHLEEADKVIMICTEKYVEKANSGSGGVGYEKMIITANLLNHINANKVIPLLKQKSTKALPTFLKSKLYIDFSKLDDQEFAFDELVRTIHDSPIFKKPPIGNNPYKEENSFVEKKSNDGFLEVMKTIIKEYNNSADKYILYNNILYGSQISRVYMDLLIKEGVDKGYLKIDKDGDIILTDQGKYYAVENKLD